MYQLLIFLIDIHSVYCANILAISVFPSYSHHSVYQGVWKELANRGHRVVSISANLINDSSIYNLEEIDISFAYDMWINKKSSTVEVGQAEIMSDIYYKLGQISNKTLALPEVQNLVKRASFDLVIAEWIYPAVFGFSEVFKCPLIGISSIDLVDPLSTSIGNPVHPVSNPGFVMPFKIATTFWERLTSLKMSLFLHYLFYYELCPTSNELIKNHLKKDAPDIQDIIKNVSVVFVNSNFLFSTPRQNMPNVIEFSGLHIKENKPLPQDIQIFLDDAKQGAIYFSLGSCIKSHMLPEELKTIFLETFFELPYKILWKVDDKNVTIKHENIKISEWLPQQDILAHKNVKLFITQGGMQSTEEAIRSRVPMVGIPFIVDQPKNIRAMAKLGIAKYIDKSTVTKEIFKKAIIEVIENPQYREKINSLANILEDEPIKGLDKVIWWIEFVIRHRGAPHLRSPFLDIPWYQYYMLDILLFIACIVLSVLFSIVLLIREISRCLVSTKQKDD